MASVGLATRMARRVHWAAAAIERFWLQADKRSGRSREDVTRLLRRFLEVPLIGKTIKYAFLNTVS